MKAVWIGALALAVPCLATAGERFDIAVTVDDLPAHGKLPSGASARSCCPR
jgi:hypothetical protein